MQSNSILLHRRDGLTQCMLQNCVNRVLTEHALCDTNQILQLYLDIWQLEVSQISCLPTS